LSATTQLVRSAKIEPYFMRIRTLFAGQKHRLVLSLSPHSLSLLHFQRGVVGWKRVHAKTLDLLEGDEYLSQVQNSIAQCFLEWKLPSGTFAYWILAGDILGVIPPGHGEVSASAALPFSASDTRTQPDTFTGCQPCSLMWMHKDWVAEIERISTQCHLQLAEIFSRAQLFQNHVEKLPGRLKIVVEQVGNVHFLHIFNTGGMVLRTRVLENAEVTALYSVLQAEVAGLDSKTEGGNTRSICLFASAELVNKAASWSNFDIHSLKSSIEDELIEKLWRSDLEGIVIRPTHGTVVRDIVLLSVGLAVVGLIGIGFMAWHNEKLERKIDEGRNQVRKDLPNVEAAKTLKTRTLFMAEAVSAANNFREKDEAMAAFTLVLANFPPAPATLMYVRTDEKTIAFAGLGSDESVKWLKERSFPGYEPLEDWVTPDFLESSHPVIHFKTRKSTPDNPATNSAASSTAGAASRTVAQ